MPVWILVTIGPYVLDRLFTEAPGKTTTVPLWAWAIYWLLAILLQFSYGAGELVRDLESKIDDRSPKLSGRVEWHRLGRLQDGTRVLLAALRIDNRGAETKVSNWRLITRPGTPEQDKPDLEANEPTVLTDDGYTVRCNTEQYLPYVLNGKPLGANYRQGFVIFCVSTEPTAGDLIAYTFRDRLGTQYSATRPISDAGEIKSFPPELNLAVERTRQR